MEQKSNGIKAFAARSPFFFVLVFFVVSQCLNLVDTFVLPFGGLGDLVVQSLLAIGVLAWLGWLRVAGFNGPSQWRSLHLLWGPGLLALFALTGFFSYLFSHSLIQVSGAMMVVYATIYALLTGFNEEARFRGVILQALLPYGPLRAAALSALFFGLAHVNNLLVQDPLSVFALVVGGFLFGFGYAACRLRTNTIWPLILLHALGDLPTVITIFNARIISTVIGSLLYAIAGIIGSLLLACYGLFLLHPRRQPALQPETLT